MPLFDTNGNYRPLEILVTCIGCSKMLEFTAMNNKNHSDSYFVATSEKDIDTIEVCKKLGLRCLVTNAFYRNGAKFDKGFAHEHMLKNLLFNEFVLFLDVDILLPERFSKYMHNMRLDINKLYGNCRIEVTKPSHCKLLKEDRLCGPVWATDWGFGHFQLFNINSKWLKNKEVLCPSFPTEREPFGSDDFLFRKNFGESPYYIEDFWHWDSNAQEKIGIDVYHIGPIGSNSRHLYPEEFR